MKELPVNADAPFNAAKEKDHSSFTELIQMKTFVISRKFVGRKLLF